MKSFILLIACVAGCSATCLHLFSTPSILEWDYRPDKLSKWNKQKNKFENIISVMNNYTTVCNVVQVSNITGKVIDVAGEELRMYMELMPNGTVSGLFGEVWIILENILQFKTRFRRVPLELIVKSLQDGYISEWMSALHFSVRSTGYFIYSYPVGYMHYELYTVSEKNEISKWWYARIFSKKLWITTGCSIIGIAGFLYLLYKFKKATCRDYNDCNGELATPSFTFLSMLGVMTGQGFQIIPASWSLRITVLTATVMGMLISCGFNSSLTSYLAIRGNSLPFNDLEDILKTKSHSICVRVNTRAYEELNKRVVEDKADWGHLINKNCPDMWNTTEFRERLCQPGVVYIEMPEVFIPIYKPIQEDCHIIKIPGKYFSSQTAFLHARSSPHSRIMDKYLMRLQSTGILKYLETKWLPKVLPNPNDRQFTFHKVEREHIQLVGMTLVTMVFVSGFICLLENIWFNFESMKGRKELIMQRKKRLKLLMMKGPKKFPTIELDPTSKQLWAINLRN